MRSLGSSLESMIGRVLFDVAHTAELRSAEEEEEGEEGDLEGIVGPFSFSFSFLTSPLSFSSRGVRNVR